jgi:uncharacterized protein YecE (DUF72 family)
MGYTKDMIYFCTSGFSYDDWVGNFYPVGMPKQEWLVYYAHEFNTYELDSTFYALLKLSSIKAILEKTDEGFLLPSLAMVTSRIGYIRFHGCNSAKWWQHEQAYERYDYNYAPQELSQWLPKIQKLDSIAGKTFIFTNNHWRGQAVSTIRQLRVMLD